MLITFKCQATANITMFGSIAQQLIQMIGASQAIPSAIIAEDIPDALKRLQSALANHPAVNSPSTPEEDDEQDEPTVSLAHRAAPLIDMLKAAIQDEAESSLC